jgi:glycosyltransferase involved in cell wall biosynthesis
MRVLHVTECFSAGTGAVVNQIPEALPADEHHLLWHADGDPCEPAGFASAEAMPTGTRARIRAVELVARRIRPDLIHAHSSWAGVYTRLAGTGLPIVYQPHCFGFVNPSVSAAQRLVARLIEEGLAHRASAIVAVSPHEARLAGRVTRHTRTSVAYVPNRPSLPMRHIGRARQSRSTVSMIGRLTPQKDPAFFAEVAERLAATDPAVRFRWIGDGSDAGFRRLLQRAGVEITGWLNSDQMADALITSDLYLHSAAAEGFPISVLDAAAMGLPVVVREIAAFAGLPLVKVGSAAEAATSVAEILRSADRRRRAIGATQELLRTMNPSHQAAALAAVYHQAIGVR